MFRYTNYIILVFIVFLSCRVQKENNGMDSLIDCKFGKVLLETEPLSYYINQFDPWQSIRIIDLTRWLDQGHCYFKAHGVFITDKIKFDLNTGNYIDIIIYKRKKIGKGKYEFEIFYAILPRNGDCRFGTKMQGFGLVNIANDTVTIENFKVKIVDLF